MKGCFSEGKGYEFHPVVSRLCVREKERIGEEANHWNERVNKAVSEDACDYDEGCSGETSECGPHNKKCTLPNTFKKTELITMTLAPFCNTILFTLDDDHCFSTQWHTYAMKMWPNIPCVNIEPISILELGKM